jgi:hypothetical protein
MDLNDPAFEILDFGNEGADFSGFDIRYVGRGNKGYAAISNLKEPVLVTTTPNIGTKGYPIAKSKSCKNLVHIFHHTGSIGSYHKFSLDCFDTIILAGQEFEQDVRELEFKRKQPTKKILIGGLPYMDNLIKRASSLDAVRDAKTILIASTWDKMSCLKVYGAGFIIDIAQAGFNVIVRPHPHSYIYEKDFIEKLQQQLKPYTNIKFDDEIDNLKSLARADILISDISGVRFDFLFAFFRPIISLETGQADITNYEYADLDRFWDYEISESLGGYIRKDEIDGIVGKIKDLIGKKPAVDKDKIIANVGSSAKVIAGQIAKMIKD